MAPLVVRGVALGLSLVWEIDLRALQRGTSRSIEIVRYINRALDTRASAVSRRPGKCLDDTTRGLGRATVWAPADLWEEVDATAARLEVSASEAARVLINAGLAAFAPEPDLLSLDAFRARSLAALAEPITAREFSAKMWPDVIDGPVLRNCARRALTAMDADGLLERLPRTWNSPVRWRART